MDRTPNPKMHDPADTDIHSAEGAAPYPKPGKTKVEKGTQDDTADPGDTTRGAPHDRGKDDKDGDYKRALEQQTEKLGDDVEVWKKGRTQN